MTGTTPHPFTSSDPFFRTPALPLDFLSGWSSGLRTPEAAGQDLEPALAADRAALRARLREAVQGPDIREALFIASPDLEALLDSWLKDRLGSEKQIRLEHSLVRYLVRMASRPTPFGLFAGWSLGWWGPATCLAVPARPDCTRHTRLDLDYLCALVEGLERDPAVRRTLLYRPNNSLYEVAGRLRYTEARPGSGRGREYHLVALTPGEGLQATLERAAGGASLAALAGSLVTEDGATPAQADAFIDELVQSQVLVSGLHPPTTGPEPIRGLVGRLQSHPDTRGLAQRLEAVASAVAGLDRAGPGQPPAVYRALARQLESLPARIDLQHLFQVDLAKPSPRARLGGSVRRALEDGVDLLHRLSQPRPAGPMQDFKDAFLGRYDQRWVPLQEALDEGAGIGFEGPEGRETWASRLLEGLAFPDGGKAAGLTLTRRDTYLLKRLMARRESLEWELTDEDIQALSNPDPLPLPDAFAVTATVIAASADAVDAGDYRFLMTRYHGPSGARMLGRFCHGDPQLQALVKAHLRSEEELRPGCVFAEVAYLPEGRQGNILCRPLLRGYEIPFLGASGAPAERQIPVQDLLVSVVGDRVVLRSRRLDREVLPRLTSAHNYNRGLSLYRFLCKLQDQDGDSGGWSWGSLDRLPFLPRIRRGRQVLARARWQFEAGDFKPVLDARGAEAHRALRVLRETFRLPRQVMLADGDHELLVDLEHPLWTEAFLRLVPGRAFSLHEFYPGAGELLAEGPEGRFCHELVLPFLGRRVPAEPDAVPAPHGAALPGPVARSFPPGSEWLYLKLYTGIITANQLLVQGLAPLLAETRELWDRWFFIRFRDPRHHLRVRFHGDPERMRASLLPRLHRAFGQWMEQGWCWKIQIGTYDRELERFGGALGIHIAEELFWHDSEAALALLKAYPGEPGADLRWQMGLKGVDLLLSDLGFDLEARRGIAHSARNRFSQEFKAGQGLDGQMGAKFRQLRPELEPFLFDTAAPLAVHCPGLDILAERSNRYKDCLAELERAEAAGLLGLPRATLLESYAHLHLNRLLRAAQRAQEFVIYDFLDRLYQSRIARSKVQSTCLPGPSGQ